LVKFKASLAWAEVSAWAVAKADQYAEICNELPRKVRKMWNKCEFKIVVL
jgi:hypothetical protein